MSANNVDREPSPVFSETEEEQMLKTDDKEPPAMQIDEMHTTPTGGTPVIQTGETPTDGVDEFSEAMQWVENLSLKDKISPLKMTPSKETAASTPATQLLEQPQPPQTLQPPQFGMSGFRIPRATGNAVKRPQISPLAAIDRAGTTA
ncbi:hypothetical protein V9T40_006017 [Parthenolecanium corni]|uniref:Uncharacterized protein n=1 Tax=Parthenolecanium corni TaxID=536013 RepID=A0AAN9TX96_9HEMI